MGRRRRSLAPRRRLERLRVPLPSADQPVWLGVDIGGSRAVSALIGVTDHLHVTEIHLYNGDNAVLNITDKIIGSPRAGQSSRSPTTRGATTR